jgi:hypothetical protein
MTRCRDEKDPDVVGCLGEADPRYEMRFDDLGEPPIQWCSACGPRAHAMNAALVEAIRDPEKAATIERMLDAAEASGRN